MLGVDRVNVSFAARTVLRDIEFDISAGEFCGLIGSNGSGKTTLLRTILGFVKPTEGQVVMRGGRTAGAIGYVPQKIDFDPLLPLRARDLVALGLDGNRLGLPLGARKRRARIDDMLMAVGATDYADQRVGRLSGGQQQRILIAHALVRQPRLLLLDEPLANLDIQSVASIVGLLRQLASQQQIAILLSAHDMNPLLSSMDRIVYLAQGRAASGTVAEVVSTAVLSRLYGYHIDVIRVHGRILVVAEESQPAARAAIAQNPVHVDTVR